MEVLQVQFTVEPVHVGVKVTLKPVVPNVVELAFTVTVPLAATVPSATNLVEFIATPVIEVQPLFSWHISVTAVRAEEAAKSSSEARALTV